MMKTFKAIIFMAALTIAWGCSSSSSSDEDNTNPVGFTSTVLKSPYRPEWKIDLMMNDAAPNWEAPDASNFESSMTVLVKLPDELVPYSTDEDKMAVFVNDECRAVSVRNLFNSGGFDEVYFVLNVRGTATADNGEYRLEYYSGGAHHLFTQTGISSTFVNEYIRTDGELVAGLLVGNHKYPVKSLVRVLFPYEIPFDMIDLERDVVGAFVDGECRGLARPLNEMTIVADNMGEMVELRYYSSRSNSIYVMKDKIRLRSTSMTMDFIF